MGAAEKLVENKQCYTLLEYLNLEPTLEGKFEFRNGEIVAMAGGTLNHSMIGGNLVAVLKQTLRGSGCLTFNSDLKVFIEKYNHGVFPDAMVICDAPEMFENRNDMVLNPSLVIEVLSKSTESYDRGEKFLRYRSLPSFKEYVLISSDKYLVESFYKESSSYWQMRTAIGLDAEIHLFSIDKTIALKDIYENVTDVKDIYDILSEEPKQ
jgi:Uma2 family endonuclease